MSVLKTRIEQFNPELMKSTEPFVSIKSSGSKQRFIYNHLDAYMTSLKEMKDHASFDCQIRFSDTDLLPAHLFILQARCRSVAKATQDEKVPGLSWDSSSRVLTVAEPLGGITYDQFKDLLYTGTASFPEEWVRTCLSLAACLDCEVLSRMNAQLRESTGSDSVDIKSVERLLQSGIDAHNKYPSSTTKHLILSEISKLDEPESIVRVCGKIPTKILAEIVSSKKFPLAEDQIYDLIVSKIRDHFTADVKRETVIADPEYKALLEDVRLPLLTAERFVTAAVPSGLFDVDAMLEAVQYIIDPDFISARKQKAKRFQSRGGKVFSVDRGTPSGSSWYFSSTTTADPNRDAISIRVDRAVRFHGIGHFTPNNGNGSAQLTVYSSGSELATVTKTFSGSAPPSRRHIDEVKFKRPLKMVPGKTYEIVLRQRGDNCVYVTGASTTLRIPEIKLTINVSSCSRSNNGTGTTQGQIPRLFFSI